MTDLQVAQTKRFDDALESAVLQNWNELLPHAPSAQIHIEYETDDKGDLEFLKIWASTVRGYWNLVCEMWLQALWSNAVGLRFANDFHSAELAVEVEKATREAGADKSRNHHGLILLGPSMVDERSITLSSGPRIAAA
jgi:hypothetical protein